MHRIFKQACTSEFLHYIIVEYLAGKSEKVGKKRRVGLGDTGVLAFPPAPITGQSANTTQADSHLV